MLLIAATGTPAIAANTDIETPWALQVRQAGDGYTAIARGATVSDLKAVLGLPSNRTSDPVWQYSGYHADDLSKPHARECSVLLVTISDGRVADLKLVNRSGAKLAAQAVNSGKPITYVVTPKPVLMADQSRPRVEGN
jgi:hypothetical protein